MLELRTDSGTLALNASDRMIMKTLAVIGALLLAVLFLSGAPDVTAQAPTPTPDYDKNEIYLGVELGVQDIEIRVPNTNDLKYDPAKHAIGPRFEYVRKVARYVGIGARAGVQFGGENRDGQVFPCVGTPNCTVTIRGESKIAIAHFSYITRFQKPKGKWRPYVDLAAGMSRTQWNGINTSGQFALGTHRNSFTAGGGAGLDIGPVRFGADYLNTAGGLGEGRRHNILFHIGFVKRFGRR